jgi:hypothetical protein
MLTQEDAKTYWGTIGFEQQNDDEQENNESLEEIIGDEPASASSTMSEASNDKPEVRGQRLCYHGLGGSSCSVALFIMQ